MSSKDFKIEEVKSEVPSEISQFADNYDRILHTGSRVIQAENAWRNGYQSPNDDDYIVLCKDNNQAADLVLSIREQGWVLGDSMGDTNSTVSLHPNHSVLEDGTWSNNNLFVSYKYVFPSVDAVNGELTDYKIPLNLLITCNEEYFDDFTRATFLAKSLELNRKEDRIVLFEAVTRNKWPDGERKKEDSRRRIFKTKLPMYLTSSTITHYTGNGVLDAVVNPPIIGGVGVAQEPDWNTVDLDEAIPTGTQIQQFWNQNNQAITAIEAVNQHIANQAETIATHQNNVWAAEGTI